MKRLVLMPAALLALATLAWADDDRIDVGGKTFARIATAPKDIIRWYHTGGSDACQQPLMRSEVAAAYSELVKIKNDIKTRIFQNSQATILNYTFDSDTLSLTFTSDQATCFAVDKMSTSANGL
jgi:hypothetical protein